MSTAKSIEDAEHAKIYGRINAVESKVDETNGYLKGVVETNEKLLALMDKRDVMFWRTICVLAFIAILAVAAVIVGAIGKEGLYAARKIVPIASDALPAHNDFDKYAHNNTNKEAKK